MGWRETGVFWKKCRSEAVEASLNPAHVIVGSLDTDFTFVPGPKPYQCVLLFDRVGETAWHNLIRSFHGHVHYPGVKDSREV